MERYVGDSKVQIHDWLAALGVQFEALVRPPGNSAPRLHLTRGKGWGLVRSLVQECLKYPNIRFVWAAKAERLLVEKEAVRGIAAVNLRTNARSEHRGRSTIIATGGFQSNLDWVRKYWPAGMPAAPRLLLGAGHNATGSGHRLVEQAGGRLTRMDHQWNYILGLPDPRDPAGQRGLAAFNFRSIWVNAEGRRFTQEFGDPKKALADLLAQAGGSYWSVFDEGGKRGLSVTLAGWENFEELSRLIYGAEGVAMTASTLEELARKMGVPEAGLAATVRRYNTLAEQGVDVDFQAFGPKTTPQPAKIEKPPFYALRFFPITRKSMGGIDVDLRCRVLDRSGQPIPGLYAAGEVTGFGGLNGKAALEGTFLGPSVWMGRIAGREASGAATKPKAVSLRRAPIDRPQRRFQDEACLRCHDVAREVQRIRPGFWHYEQSHAKALARDYRCSNCHADLYPYRRSKHKLDRAAATGQCATCHGVQSRPG